MIGARRVSLWAPLALVLALALPFCFFGLHSADSDVYYHLAAGRWMAAHGSVLGHEAFSFTAEGRPWTNYYWAFEWLIYAAFQMGALPAVLVVRGALILGFLALFVAWVHRRTGGALLETATFSACALALYLPRAVSIRPHLFSYLFLIMALFLLDAFRQGRDRAGVALAGLCVLWANLHGVEYPVLLATVGAFMLEMARPYFGRPMGAVLRDRGVVRFAILGGACAAAFLANPFGARLLATPRIGLDREVMAQIAEMQPPPLDSRLLPPLDLWAGRATLFHLLALAGLLLLPGWLRRREVIPASLFGLGLALGLDKRRFAVEFLILAVPFVAEGVARVRSAHPAQGPPLRWALLVTAIYCGGSAVASTRAQVRAGATEVESASFQPMGAVRFLTQTGLGGALLCDPTVAGYVTWGLFPQVRILADMRAPEPFGARELWLAQAVGSAVTLETVADRLPIDLVLARRREDLARRLLADPTSRFRLVHADPSFVVFAHERTLVGRSDLELRTLSFLERLESGALITSEPAPPELGVEAARLAGMWDGNTLAHRALLWLALSQGRTGDARARARELEARYPREAAYPFLLGAAAAQEGDVGTAAAAFQRVLDADPDLTQARPFLAEALLALQRPSEAAEVMEAHAWKRWPVLSASDYMLLGRARSRAGRAVAAVEAYERAAWLLAPGAPQLPDLDNDLGVENLVLGHPERALMLFERSLARKPTAITRLNRARALRRLGRGPEADRILDQLLGDPTTPAAVRPLIAAQRRS